ncbi:hypothetical protein [Streptomyces mangrovisoli]|uniref:WD40 repeat domain-containing protein n=1 Tax=Streptomyces mangrovisoli TaxID=1428628 RepID=A0A1J4NL59_9ACTN|nr:hypothetical protein [Streptomyces mangrovisoli]OIJ63137.1 hypothetical protein WN71_035855 [Streptomyces mangrovisoli]
MNVEELVRAALREQADEQPPPGAGLADRVLTVRRRRRNRRIASVAGAAAAVITVAVGVPRLTSGGHDVRPSGVVDSHTVSAHPKQSPPTELVAAGRTALAAYYTSKSVFSNAHDGVSTRTYWLLDPKSGRYEKTTRWSWVAVAPGLHTAAVLEQHLPVRRIGLLDLASGKIKRWIPVDHPVGGLAFSPDGTKIVATTYGDNPDRFYQEDKSGNAFREVPCSRTGFYVLDAASGKGSWAAVDTTSDDPDAEPVNTRQDFAFSQSGGSIMTATSTAPWIGFYDVHGRPVEAPASEAHRSWYVLAGLSPDGTKLAGDFAGKKWHTSSWLLDPVTGKPKTEIHGQQLLAWASDKSLIAWDLTKGEKNEFHQRLVLVTIGSDKEVPLSGFRKGNDGAAGRWQPIFADR